ncbi:MAG: AMP-binding protein [Candidatus Obscuribacterales bacterium]|nr:AMP-binding protein [Candidatus Obscuribacterales bacterium]
MVACNVPAKLTLADGRVVDGTKFGTVGLPLPGTSIRICDENSGMEIPTGKAGMIKIKGPQVMMGYLNQPEATEKVLLDGWFTKGDIGYLDQDGFLTITGRLSQFSKIVPHLAVEDEIMKVTGIKQQTICVTSVADQNRGERLIVVYSDLGMTPEKVVELLRSSNLSRLWIQASADFIRIEKMPILPSGKLDLNSVKSEVARAVRDNATQTEQDDGSHAVW